MSDHPELDLSLAAPAVEVSAARQLVPDPAAASVALTMSRCGQPQLVQDAPAEQLLSELLQRSPGFFEKVVVNLLRSHSSLALDFRRS